jgi:type IV pilus assembly protein PilM
MLAILDLKLETFGLDIDDAFLKITKLKKKRGGFCLVSFGEKELAKGIMDEGVIKDEDAFVKNLKNALANINGEKIKTKYVLASLPEKKSFSQVIKMPKMDPEELKSAVIYEVENYIPLPIDKMYLGFKTIGLNTNLNKLEVFIVAIEKTIVDSYVSCLKKAGLIPVALEVETQSVARSLIAGEKTLNPVALIDIGEDNSSFIIFSEQSVRFTSSIAISSNKITEIISNKLGISLKEAQHMKTKYGVGSLKPSHRAKAVFKAVEPLLEEMVSEIKKYIDFYLTHDLAESSGKKNKNKSGIEKIILSGTGANLKGIEGFLNKKLSIQTQIGDPQINFSKKDRKKIPVEFEKKSLSFVVSLGLSLIDSNKIIEF